MDLSTPIGEVKGVGPELEKNLNQVGVFSVEDLINYYPRRYDDYSRLLPIAKIKPGPVSLRVKISHVTGRYVRRGMHITEAIASDDTGSVRLVWFNQPYRKNHIKSDTEYFIAGEHALNYRRFSIQNPSVELVSDFPINAARIVPIYRESKKLKSIQIRKIMSVLVPLIDELPENLPKWLIAKHRFISRAEAIKSVHFPADSSQLEAAKKRLGFEEVFQITLAALLNKYELLQNGSPVVKFDEQAAKDFVSLLKFKLTDDQRKAVWRICLDLQKPTPMNRLLEGDVGSGKTVVAAMTALMAINNDYQVALMAPTEILARQHAETIFNLLTPLGLSSRVGLLVGSMKNAQKELVRTEIKEGKVKFIIGTHALIQEKLAVKNLGLVIIDEQHRFGVEQRKKLQIKAKMLPHVLSMTATPIPRSLALTLYGDLDITIIAQKPVGRKDIQTELVAPTSAAKVYERLNDLITSGQQVYVVCPLIRESESLQFKSAEQVYEELKKSQFKTKRVGLLHGKLKAQEKEQIMTEFSEGKIDVLVSTTVIEVGVDVPNATAMVILSPERFGLAQIHQLRGRVGRSELQSHCYLMLDGNNPPSRRLKALEQTNDGFKLAELDLQLRGPGSIYGSLQHGQLDLSFANLTDTKTIAVARSDAQEFIDKGENLLKYTQLNEAVSEIRKVTNLN